ncbi:uncharacterized protein LOC110774249 [Prunus avium]|uniref:Uncharacterized protein LOC110774249 n=1 Tax=Prunus avium TaxID=42229 RepID=A0A6P5U5R2_PRUAV|nr:uncharacterized protein LOC110774249 [Prunus avium]
MAAEKSWPWLQKSHGHVCSNRRGLGIIERELQSLNKTLVKTIQPAFDNPLLKNHKIQLRPTSFPAQMKNSAPVADPISETWSKREACPDGTVPIHRTTKDDLVRAKNLAHQMFRNTGNTNPLPWNIHETQGAKYFGVWGIGYVYNLSLDSEDQSSSGNVFVIRGPRNELNVLVAGWMVSPSINSDQLPRLYTYWTEGKPLIDSEELTMKLLEEPDLAAARLLEMRH